MRRAQAALEYLFMISLALVMVLVVVRALREVASTASRQTEQVSEEILRTLNSTMNGGSGENMAQG